MDDYEYRGLMAQAWDLLRGDTSRWADRFFYFDLIREFGQPVLDVGCCTGRLLLESEWEKLVERPDGAVVRRVARSRYAPATECEHTEDLYQVIVDGQVVAEEQHRRSPATRSYTQAKARALFERARFADVRLYSEFTHELVKPQDTLFTVVARRLP